MYFHAFCFFFFFFFFFNDTATTEIYTFPTRLSSDLQTQIRHPRDLGLLEERGDRRRSEEHTSELQSRRDLVCRLLLEKKKRTDARSSVRSLDTGRTCAPRRESPVYSGAARGRRTACTSLVSCPAPLPIFFF